MLGNIKEKIVTLGEGLKQQFTTETEPNNDGCVNLLAGAKIVSHYQTCWRTLHDNAQLVAKQAEVTDRDVSRAAAEYDKQTRYVGKMSSLVSCLPEVNQQIEDVMKCLGQLENLFMEVELSLLALEDTIDARDAQERQLERRFQIAIYQEKRRQELEDLESRLELQYQKKIKEQELRDNEQKKERQAVFQAKFNEDMNRFSEKGFLEVPLTRPSDVSLESIDLDHDDGAMEAFLKDDCPGASPLPRDDIPLMQGPLSPVSPMVNINIQTPSSGDQSLHTTPNITTDTVDNIHNK